MQRPTTYRLALERLPDNGTVHDCVFRQPTARHDATLGDVVCVHHTDDIIVPRTYSFHVIQELLRQVFLHMGAEERWVQSKDMFEKVDEEHRDRCNVRRARPDRPALRVRHVNPGVKCFVREDRTRRAMESVYGCRVRPSVIISKSNSA